MISENRWVYVGGVAVLVALIVVGVVWGRRDTPAAAADGGSPRAADGGRAARGTDGGVAPEGDGAPANASPAGDGGDDIGDVPSDPVACRDYCRDLARRGALAEGATADSCVAQLCPAGARDPGRQDDDATAADPMPTASEPDVPALPDDCPAQCRALHERGELRAGMSVDDCVAAMCAAADEEPAAE